MTNILLKIVFTSIGNFTTFISADKRTVLQGCYTYSNCRVAHPGTLLECPIFSLTMEQGKSLNVQEHVQTDWFFYKNSNYKTKNTDDKWRICVVLQWFWSQCYYIYSLFVHLNYI